MADWNTRLAVSYEDESGTHLIVPVDSFSSTFTLNAEVLHSIEDTHLGVVYSPQAISFTLTVKAIGDIAARLTALALEGKRFNIILQEAEGGSDWSFAKLVLGECVITNAAKTVSVTGAPTETFSGFSLSARAESKTGATVGIP